MDESINIVYISDIAPYNEYDYACNGGYYNCPNCQSQLYITETYDKKKDICNFCNQEHIFISKN